MVGGNTKRAVFLSYLLIIFVLFLSLTSIIFELTGALFVVELLFLGLSLLIAVILLRGMHKRRAWAGPVALILFSVQLLNLIGMFFSVSFNQVVLPLAVSVIGMFLSMNHIGRSAKAKKYKVVGKKASKKAKKSVKKKAAKKKSAKKTSKKKVKKKTTKKKR